MQYYRLMLGQKGEHASSCLSENFVGVSYGIKEDLSALLDKDAKEFNHTLIPKFLDAHPEKSKISAGLACGSLWTVCKGMQIGDRILSPDDQNKGVYHVGEITGDYVYAPEQILPHRRPVRWLPQTLNAERMSTELRNSIKSQGALRNISSYQEEFELLLKFDTVPDGSKPFTMEKYLEEFLIANWAQTELGKDYDIYEEDGEVIGQQYPADNGRIDILASSKNKKELLVVELKKGNASDKVVGQILRYMGYVKQELAKTDQDVKGVIIAHEDELSIRRALAMVPEVSFYKYEVSFKLARTKA